MTAEDFSWVEDNEVTDETKTCIPSLSIISYLLEASA